MSKTSEQREAKEAHRRYLREMCDEYIAKCDDLLQWSEAHLIDAPHYQELIKELAGGLRGMYLVWKPPEDA